MTASVASTTPTADARSVALAHYAARGVLEHVLAWHGITFQQQLVLRAVGDARTPADVVADVHGSLKADRSDIAATIDELVARGLLAADGALVRSTQAGRDVLAATAHDVAPHSARIWGGIPEEDLAVAGRVLALVTARANAELEALTG